MMCPPPVIDLQWIGKVAIVRPIEPWLIFPEHVDTLRDDLEPLLETHPDANLLLDLQRVQYMSSMALGCLLQWEDVLRKRGGWLRLCAVCPSLQEVLSVTRLDTILVVYPSKDEALAAA